MGEPAIDIPSDSPIVALETAVTALAGMDLTRPTDAELLRSHQGLEMLRNQLAAVEHALISEEQRRGLPDAHGCRTSAVFLRGLLRVTAGDAHARVLATEAAGPRRNLTGASLDPIFVEVAAAQAEGSISPEHARIVVRTVDTLPDQVQAEHGRQIEAELVAYARRFDPRQLAKLAARVAYCYDQDGTLKDQAYREQHRDLTVRQRPDGSAALSGELTAECAEHLLVHFDALAKPVSGPDNTPDPRTAGQRRHDALLASLALAERADLLPTGQGVTATVIVTMTDDAYRTGAGFATTSHGAQVPADTARAWGGADKQLLAVALNHMRAVTAHSGLHRLFRPAQRLALCAQYGGCAFPGCDAPISRCEIHHLDDWARGGKTVLANGLPLCPYNHRHHQRQGWQPKRSNGRISWLPPAWIDPTRTPRYNTAHCPRD
jgi:Domain of unknown function (DUF222)